MDESSRILPLWHRFLDWLLHPIVLFLLLGVTVYSAWFLSNPITRRVSAFLSFLVMALLVRFYYATQRIKRAIEDVELERDRVWSPKIEAERLKLRKAIETTSASTWVNITPRSIPQGG